jgi:hypothetical protein
MISLCSAPIGWLAPRSPSFLGCWQSLPRAPAGAEGITRGLPNTPCVWHQSEVERDGPPLQTAARHIVTVRLQRATPSNPMSNRRVLSRVFVAALALTWPAGCRRSSSGPADAGTLDASEASVVPVVTLAFDAGPTPRADPPKAVATLIVQRVDAHCVACLEEPSPPDKLIGYDLLFEVTSADGTREGKPEHVFCPKTLPDGGPLKPRLGPAMECRAFKACEVVSPDAGDSERAEITCDAERVSLASDGGRTILKGSFGEREIAPYATRIAPTKRTVRKALHD